MTKVKVTPFHEKLSFQSPQFDMEGPNLSKLFCPQHSTTTMYYNISKWDFKSLDLLKHHSIGTQLNLFLGYEEQNLFWIMDWKHN